ARRHALEVIKDHECVGLLQRAIAARRSLSGRLRLGAPPASPRTFHVRVSPIKAPDESVAGAVCVLHDQTELLRLERVRSDFVANVSHELRTPLTAVHGFIETLQQGSYRDPERAKRYLEIMHTETTRLIAIINDLLQLSRLEGPADVRAREPLNLGRLAREVLELVRQRADETGLVLSVDVAGEDEPFLVRPLAHKLDDFASELPKVQGLPGEHVRGPLKARKLQKIVDDGDEPRRLRVHDLKVPFGTLRVAIGSLLQGFDKPMDRGEGRAKLMGDV